MGSIVGQVSVEQSILPTLIEMCDALAFGRECDPAPLYRYTREDAGPVDLVRLAEAFGMMLVKVESRELHRDKVIEDLQLRNVELEKVRRLLEERSARLIHSVQEAYGAERIVGSCEAMRKVIKLTMSISRNPIDTLITGPTGSGKEIIAKTLHYNSPRRNSHFVAVNCTAIPDSLFEAEMFGIERGIATGVNARKGLLETAHEGTLFLDEVAEMPLPNQAKLLRVLEEREILRVGGSKLIPIDINLITATHVNLEEAVRQGKFRQDLYYRINVVEIHIPPLCARGDDILLLATLFLERHCKRRHRSPLTLSPDVCKILLAYPWPGNVRELTNEMERITALATGPIVMPHELSPRLSSLVNGTVERQPERLRPCWDQRELNIERMEKALVKAALQHAGGNKSRAADLLGITREGLRRKLLRMQENAGTSAALPNTNDDLRRP